jgi:TolB-like protein
LAVTVTDPLARLVAALADRYPLAPEHGRGGMATRRRAMKRVAVLAVLAVAAVVHRAWAQCPDGTPPPCAERRAAPAPNSVAVLAFEDPGHDTSLVWLGVGLAEEVATELGGVPGVIVRGAGIVRSASRVASGDARRVAQLVSVHYVVEGSVQPVGPRVHVRARLVAMPAGEEHWGRVYDRSRDSLGSLSNAIANDLAAALGASARPAAPRAPDPQAYEAYERGRFFFLRGDPSTARSLFEQAIRRDSTFTPAWAGLARAWGDLADNWIAPLEAYPPSRNAAHRALALDSTIASAYVALGWVAVALDRDCWEALRLAGRAVALDSTLPDAWQIRSFSLACLRRGAEALATARRAWDLDSLSALFGNALLNVTEYVAPERLPAALALVKGRQGPYSAAFWEADVALQRGDCATGERLLRPLLEDHGPGSSTAYAVALACLGRRAEADSVVRAVIADTAGGYVNPVWVAWGLLALDDRDAAIRWLERGAEERTAWVMFIHLDPDFAPLRGDPRFVALERRLGLEP